MNGPVRIILASGGTGGHVFPALAVAEELTGRHFAVSLATDPRGAGVGALPAGVDLHRLDIAAFSGGYCSRIRGGLSLTLATVQAWQLLGRLKAAAVIGFGGYPSVPAVLAAVARRLPSLIHEQNALLGRANRLLASRATAIALSFEQTVGLRPQQRAKAVVTGNPVRRIFSDIRTCPYARPHAGTLRLLVLGGSQGARIFSDVVPEAIASLPESVRQRISITQQCRKDDLAKVGQRYRGIGLEAELAAFFEDVPRRMADCQLVISRSGASTIAELGEAGRPAILVPYPHATGDHQTANARAVEKQGGGWLIPAERFTPETLAGRLIHLLAEPQDLTEAADAMRETGGRHAARLLVDHLERILRSRAADRRESPR